MIVILVTLSGNVSFFTLQYKHVVRELIYPPAVLTVWRNVYIV